MKSSNLFAILKKLLKKSPGLHIQPLMPAMHVSAETVMPGRDPYNVKMLEPVSALSVPGKNNSTDAVFNDDCFSGKTYSGFLAKEHTGEPVPFTIAFGNGKMGYSYDHCSIALLHDYQLQGQGQAVCLVACNAFGIRSADRFRFLAMDRGLFVHWVSDMDGASRDTYRGQLKEIKIKQTL